MVLSDCMRNFSIDDLGRLGMTSHSMRERAAKVADAFEAKADASLKDNEGMLGDLSVSHLKGCSETAYCIARQIRALPDDPDPTRAALRDNIETAYIKLASLARMPAAENPDWSPSVGNPADAEALDKAFKAIRTARNALGKGE